MLVNIPDNLVELAKIFAKYTPLYVVGGAVRNSLLDYKINDYDITSDMLAEDVEKLLDGSNFQIVACYKRTGTLVIKCGKDSYEYTTFRQDSYPLNSGEHTPAFCTFTKDINIDAHRRDFSCNALYYDIIADKIIDLVGGVADIKNKVLRTVNLPEITLREDSLRIMRLVRFSLQLGFSIDFDTYKQAKENAKLLKDISKERIKEELISIFEGVFKYNSKALGVKPSDGIRLLVDMGAMEHIIPELLDMVGVEQNAKYHIYDVYNHTLATMDNLPPRLMMAGLLHDIAKPVLLKKNGNMYAHELLGSDMAREIMTRLKFSNYDIERISRLVRIHMFNVDNKTRNSKCRVFIADNFDYFEDFISLRRADGLATNPDNYDDSGSKQMIEIKENLLHDKMPITLRELPINGHDLLSLGYSGKEISEILNKLRLWILQNNRIPAKEEIINKLRR